MISPRINFEAARVAVIGDFLLDKYITGKVSRISPEAPIPVLLKQGDTVVLGGAGNVAANIKTLGATPIPVGLLGDSAQAREVCNLLGRQGIDHRYLEVTGQRSVPVKTRLIGGHQQILRLDQETIQAPSAEEKHWLLDAAESIECDIVILSDYGKGLFLDGMSEVLINVFAKRGIPVLVDPKGTDYTKYRGATALTPNLKELCEACDATVETSDDITNAARQLIQDLDLDFLLSTRGQDGLSVVKATSVLHMPTFAREVFDVSGAGDTLIAAFAVALAVGQSTAEGARIANAAAGLVVAKNGTATVSAEELEQALSHRRHGIEDVVVSRERAQEKMADWQARGLRVGFTNGCFDILHPGHVSLLAESAKACDRLVVGLNSDTSVQRLKGPSRPVVDQESRARVISALGMVDLVVLFEEDTPFEVISDLLPDVLIKGSDYEEHEIVGADVVKANGGQIVRAQLIDGKSTTRIVERIREENRAKQ